MGKFDGVLIASDFDNTMVYTEDALLHTGIIPPLSAANREAIEYFMRQGGIFSVATGRALPAFETLAPLLPMNGPTILFNGAAIYDFPARQYVATRFLPAEATDYIAQLEDAFPRLAYEAYHDGSLAHMVHPNALMRNHVRLNKNPSVEAESIRQVPLPLSKVVFEESEERCSDLERYIRQQPWAENYEIVKSGRYFLEITAKGATKGGMVRQLAELLHIRPENICCAGDQANDLSMLRCAGHAFAPANAIEAVRSEPGVTLLPHAREDAMAALIRHLDCLYP